MCDSLAPWTCVSQGTVEVIQRWGKFRKFAEPGCHCVCPCIGDAVAGKISTRIRSLDVAVETKTKDNVFVTIIVSTQFMVLKDASRMYDAFYKLTDSREQIRSYIFDVVRSTVPRINLDDVFTTKEEIALEVKSMLQKAMTEFGFTIIQTLVTDIAPDSKVKIAMNEINAAQRQRVAAQDRAEAEKIMVVKAAEADAEAKYLAGTGIARQRQAIINGLKESVVHFQAEVDGINSKDVMEMMMMTQYFDTMKEVGCSNGNSTIFVPSGPGAVADTAAAVRSGIMQGNAMMGK
jgi:regulator of protease activity HflC (stomatin/prohibitin superfamily)